MHQGRLLECGPPDQLYTRPATRFVSTFLGAANLLLGYRTPRGVRFSSTPGAGGDVPREVVAVLRPEEVELCADEPEIRSNFVGHGTVEEILFAGAVERLRVRMAADGPVPVAPGREGATDAGSLLEVSRTLPEQRSFPVTIGQRIAVGARRIHVLPTPISSFTAVAPTRPAARELRDSPLLSTLGTRMQTRVATRIGRFERAPPGMPAIATRPGLRQRRRMAPGPRRRAAAVRAAGRTVAESRRDPHPRRGRAPRHAGGRGEPAASRRGRGRVPRHPAAIVARDRARRAHARPARRTFGGTGRARARHAHRAAAR